MLSDEGLLVSLDRHFMAGNAALTVMQLYAHRTHDTCAQCDEIAKASAELTASVSSR